MNRIGQRGKGSLHLGRCDRGITILEILLSTSLAIVLMMSLVVLYYSAAKSAAKEENLNSATREAQLVVRRLAHDFRLVGLMAPADVNGDTNDIRRDVPDQTWSDSARDDFEYATTYQLAYTSDVDNDGQTETVWLYLNGRNLMEKEWVWSRDSVRWRMPHTSTLATDVDYVLFDYYDRDQNRIPQATGYPNGGFVLSSGDRHRVTAVEVRVVVRSDNTENGPLESLVMPDGHTFYDRYRRAEYRFMIRGRNLSLGA
jgi:type II secretory pathway pseudopilin PulG